MTQLEASAAATDLTTENERLRAELQARLEELRNCRRRMVEAIQSERRRIERDLHDGTQGRLVSMAMSLGLLEAKLPSDAEAARPIAREARQAVAAALAELRELSQGLYPAPLGERGLASALRDLCQRAALPTFLEFSDDDPPVAREVEAAVYFLVSEALTNAVKHADATAARVDIACHEDRVAVEVADDGKGGAIPGAGSGLRGLAERIGSLGGRLVVSSPRGRGTAIRAEIPCWEETAVIPVGSTGGDSCCPAGRTGLELIDSRASRAPLPRTQPQQPEPV